MLFQVMNKPGNGCCCHGNTALESLVPGVGDTLSVNVKQKYETFILDNRNKAHLRYVLQYLQILFLYKKHYIVELFIIPSCLLALIYLYHSKIYRVV